MQLGQGAASMKASLKRQLPSLVTTVTRPQSLLRHTPMEASGFRKVILGHIQCL